MKSIWAGKSIHSNTDACINTSGTVSAISGSKVMSLNTCGDNQRHPRCAILIGIWMSGTEIEVHFNFGRYDCDWTQFKLLLKCIINLVQQLLQGRKHGQITDLISLVLSFNSPTTCDTFISTRPHCEGKRKQARSVLNDWTDERKFFDQSLFHSLIETGKFFLQGGVPWEEVGSADSCKCALDFYVCNHHRIPDTNVKFLQSKGARSIVGAVTEVAQRRLPHVFMLYW